MLTPSMKERNHSPVNYVNIALSIGFERLGMRSVEPVELFCFNSIKQRETAPSLQTFSILTSNPVFSYNGLSFRTHNVHLQNMGPSGAKGLTFMSETDETHFFQGENYFLCQTL